MSTLLIQRLYDIYGESFIPVDETPDELKGPKRIRVTNTTTGDLTITREEDRPSAVKHTDMNFDSYPNGVRSLLLTTNKSRLKVAPAGADTSLSKAEGVPP